MDNWRELIESQLGILMKKVQIFQYYRQREALQWLQRELGNCFITGKNKEVPSLIVAKHDGIEILNRKQIQNKT